MSEKDPMTIDERRKYIYKMWERYRGANRSTKGNLLNEMERVTGMHRKSLIRVLKGRLSRKKRKKQRGPAYGAAVADAVRVIARSLDYPCAERLKPNLVWMGEHLMAHQALYLSNETLEKLDQISISTLKRMLQRIGRVDEKIAGFKPPKRKRNSFAAAYPMRRIPYNTPEPGHFEVDLVLHCGDNLSGEYIHTIQIVDVATGWSEIEAVFGRSYKVIKDGFERILDRLPFPVLELHPDNGSEFFNQHLIRFWNNKIVNLDISRSRPYHSNDNRFVEENNRSNVRAYTGHDRLDSLEHLETLRVLYMNVRIYHNFFQPVMHTIEKVYSDELHYRRVFDQAKPPLDRLLKCNILSLTKYQQLIRLRDQINPLEIRAKIANLVHDLWTAGKSSCSANVDIYKTLRKEKDSSVTLSFDPSIPVR